jgi:hypothetical protein
MCIPPVAHGQGNFPAWSKSFYHFSVLRRSALGLARGGVLSGRGGGGLNPDVEDGMRRQRIKATLEQFTEHHLPKLEQEPGYCGVWAGIDYTGGRAIAVTYWESNDSLLASDAVANEVRAAAVTKAGVDRNRPPIIDRYEVVLEKHPLNA